MTHLLVEIAGGAGAALTLDKGRSVKLINTFGQQVVDTWALNRHDTSEYMSVEQTRRMIENLFAKTGDIFYSNRRTPMFRLTEDSSLGRHDMLCAACDRWSYKWAGFEPGHRNCEDNYYDALFRAGFDSHHFPNPLNLWMNIPVGSDMAIEICSPHSRPGDYVVIEALMDLIVVLSACPNDFSPINGPDMQPKAVHYQFLD
ncbi:urea carboxylase-associated family protein [Mesorhizobium sp. M0902]|uniref:urea carboxylase-associated family protein n=1 Tax=Mesorhizobium sp. M0902 TaxID=2957021 RepID=UPI003338C05C